ncbi:hypothetical protein CALCODRAFT_138517 [Calocera cornea HHB12733]|uniref:Uncharacterized protein n=1 Tax=Calocera cornea HHB12733 TaxID=1353952 RepID=A0A165K2M1_9BASI|nr:hypothetical protein CALCODRAFT_138517 [Calocera cornea HHB12733]
MLMSTDRSTWCKATASHASGQRTTLTDRSWATAPRRQCLPRSERSCRTSETRQHGREELECCFGDPAKSLCTKDRSGRAFASAFCRCSTLRRGLLEFMRRARLLRLGTVLHVSSGEWAITQWDAGVPCTGGSVCWFSDCQAGNISVGSRHRNGCLRLSGRDLL